MTISRVLLVTESLSSNSLGRTFCIWRLARALGWSVQVIAVEAGDIWGPLADSDFAADCRAVPRAELPRTVKEFEADLLIACKPLPTSLGVALELVEIGQLPLMLDIDDPDLEYRLSTSEPVKALAKTVLRPRPSLEYRRLRRAARSLPTLVSNPWLQDIYGGTIIPHVRDDLGPGVEHTGSAPVVGFVGSHKPHKGVPVLRQAVARLAGSGFTLTVTDDPPEDAAPWEDWVGTTSFDAGQELIRRIDIAVIPSLDIPMARGQLPAKLMDAMLAGRAVVTTAVPPLPWGTQGTGVVVPKATVEHLVGALEPLADPDLRAQLGARAREKALASYTVEANLENFARACQDAARGDRR